MYFYMIMAVVVAFGIWFTASIKRGGAAITPQEKAAQWKGVGKILIVCAVMLTAIMTTSSYADGKTASGIAAYHQGRYAAAEADLRQSINFSIIDASPHYYLGLCLRHDGKNEEARQEFETTCSKVRGRRYKSSISNQMEQDAEVQLQQLGDKP